MTKNTVRVRFAPAPTGMMHLGNIRTALFNFLLARQKNGTYILRIEDTDPIRNYDPEATKIIEDLHWLGMDYDEGPIKGGPYIPYFQSQRDAHYKKSLDELIRKKLVYRCFCTAEELDKKRERQITLKLPPRYDRTCANLNEQEIQKKLDASTLFIWRYKIDHSLTLTITDLAHGKVTYDMSNFSDFPLTRGDGTFTFIFANFCDDMDMKVTTVIRGEDHLSNTACQAALYHTFNIPLPTFWHTPIIINIDGKKLSKRDFGFSLRDLREAGFLPQAICNYLAIIGGSYEHELMDMPTLIKTVNVDKPNTTGQITYDVEKLHWFNRKWIVQIPITELVALCRPYLEAVYPAAKNTSDAILAPILNIMKTDMVMLKDCVALLKFYFDAPTLSATDFQACIPSEQIIRIKELVTRCMPEITDSAKFAQLLKDGAKEANIPLKEAFWFVRLALMNATKGPTIHELVDMLGANEARIRLKKALNLS